MALWAAVLGGGVGIATFMGISLKDFLCRHLAIPEDYLEHRIQTILLNSRPVDDVEKTIIADGDVIALSAAMPGLAGATLRRGGHLSPMRAAISGPRRQTMPVEKSTGMVILKLFNLVAREMGPLILSGEIRLKAKQVLYLQQKTGATPNDPIPSAPDTWIQFRHGSTDSGLS